MSNEQSNQDSTNELDALRRQLQAMKRDAAVNTFIASAGQTYVGVSTADLKALISGHVKFGPDDTLSNESELSMILGSKEFLQKQAASAFVAQRMGAANHRDHGQSVFEAAEKRKAYLKQYFGAGSNPKLATELFKANPTDYRRLRAEAVQLRMI